MSARSVSCPRVLLGALFAVATVVLSGCPQSLGPDDAGPGVDAGPVTISCTAATDCPAAVPECSFGVCKRPCAANDGCVDSNTFCNQASGYCEPGCRDSTTCATGTVCSLGSCIASQGCATKCDCGVGQVCTNGSCEDPPATCTGPDQCPRGPTSPTDRCEAYSCNGFTQQCFDPDPQPCTANGDCLGRPGCAGGCTCVTDTGTCASSVACTIATENTDCTAGSFCGGGTCQTLPICNGEADCTGQGLTCNIGSGSCERPHACTTAAQCTLAPTTFCNTTTGFCAQPLCNNGGVTCTGGQACSADGRCVTQGTGAACTSDNTCAATEYCALVNNAGQCAVGCRGNSTCNPGQQCDGSHTCVGGTGGLAQFGGACTADGDCQAGLICGLFTGTCAEQCDPPDTACSGGACCTLSGAPCCVSFFGGGFCQASGC